MAYTPNRASPAAAAATAAALILALASSIISIADARLVSAGKPLSNEAITSNYLEAIRNNQVRNEACSRGLVSWGPPRIFSVPLILRDLRDFFEIFSSFLSQQTGISSGYSPTGPEIVPSPLDQILNQMSPYFFPAPPMPRLQPPPLTPLTPRQPQALLDQFFNQMPKGGDIHLHYSGGIYTEVLIASALQYDMKLCEVGGG